MRPKLAILTTLFLSVVSAVSAVESDTVTLLPAENLDAFTGAVRKPSGERSPSRAFTLKSGSLQCSRMSGFLVTKQKFDKYRLVVEYRWLTDAADRNSGVFVNTVGVSDTGVIGNVASIEIDLLGPQSEGLSGRVWLFGRGEKAITVNGKRQLKGGIAPMQTKSQENPKGEWNTLEVVSDGKKFEVKLNGKITVTGTNPVPESGKIMLQSGGIEFRRVEVTPFQ